LIAIMAFAALPCLAGEIAVLKNGFTIEHERREVVGDLTRLYVTADGASYVDVPTADIDHFEVEEQVPVPKPVSTRKTAGFNSAIPFPVRPTADLNAVVNEASGRYRLDPDLVNSVIQAESEFKVHAVSPRLSLACRTLLIRKPMLMAGPDICANCWNTTTLTWSKRWLRITPAHKKSSASAECLLITKRERTSRRS
jgi:hypothetical protein